MVIAARYSFHGGMEAVSAKYPHLLAEIEAAIASIDAEQHRSKQSKEKTMLDQMLYSPSSLNMAFKDCLYARHWKTERVQCLYSAEYYTESYRTTVTENVGFREMDFVKERLGVEVQFGKYSFMVYNVAAKMTIFRNLGHIEMGIEVVPVKRFASQMSSGVSYFEQFAWDLEQRGVADIDVPVLVLGIDGDANADTKRPRSRIVKTVALETTSDGDAAQQDSRQADGE